MTTVLVPSRWCGRNRSRILPQSAACPVVAVGPGRVKPTLLRGGGITDYGVQSECTAMTGVQHAP